VGCSRGKADPDELTIRRLFAESAGYCGRPDCERELFLDVNGARFHLADIAHIFAAGNKGPRPNPTLTPAQRGAFENLILLCLLCHREIDRAPSTYPDDMIRGWKEQHQQKLRRVFGVRVYEDRPSLRRAIEPILDENRSTWTDYGPDSDDSHNPESEMAPVWRRKVVQRILPHNHRILAVLDENRDLTNAAEKLVIEAFRQHVDDQWHRHVGGGPRMPGRRYPTALDGILKD
jgi:hypothetical protein